MTQDQACVTFLQWALPRLRLRWAGFRRVRRQVCRRVRQRFADLGLASFSEYRYYLETHPAEWAVLNDGCRVTISRFYRDRWVFDRLFSAVLPPLASAAVLAGNTAVTAWCAGCASGEEAFTLRLGWEYGLAAVYPELTLRIVATDRDPHLLGRGRAARYPSGSLGELPDEWRRLAFTDEGDMCRLRDEYRAGVTFMEQDIRRVAPAGPFHLILCRNLAFTYFDEDLQRDVLRRLTTTLVAGGILMTGRREVLPPSSSDYVAMGDGIFRYRSAAPRKQ
ncbi:MAG: chemotaxis protein CheR [Acidobacteria bacterium]|nr:chemotaxis protein CheR [Acidobacteriota bacterium]